MNPVGVTALLSQRHSKPVFPGVEKKIYDSGVDGRQDRRRPPKVWRDGVKEGGS